MASITQDLRFKQAVIEYSRAHGVTKAATRYRKTTEIFCNAVLTEAGKCVIIVGDRKLSQSFQLPKTTMF